MKDFRKTSAKDCLPYPGLPDRRPGPGMATLLFLFILLSLPIHSQTKDSTVAEPPEPVRGIWIVRHNLTSPQRIDSVIALSERLGFTDLFVQVRGRGDAYYNSRFEPRAENLPDDWDPLAYFLARSEGKPFRVHAWMNVFYLWSRPGLPADSTHLVNRRPEWLVHPPQLDSANGDTTLNGHRSIEGLFNSPVNPEVRQHLLNVFDDLLSQYDLDGIHFDYLRFPGFGVDFDSSARQKFRQRYVLDPLEFKRNPDRFVAAYGKTGYELFYERWGEFLRQELTECVKTFAEHIRRNYPNLIISAAVKPDLEKAYWQFYQPWDRWLQQGWLDWAIPMNYTPNDRLFLSRLERILKKSYPSQVLMGISLYNQQPDSALRKIRRSNGVDLGGVVLFSYDQLAKDKVLRLKYRQLLKSK